MRNIYILCLIGFLVFQNNTEALSTIDSLRNVWQDKKKDPNIRLDAMYRSIWDNYLFNQTDSSQHYCKVMFNLAEEFGDTIHMAEALYLSGIAYNISGDYEKSKQKYDSSMALSVLINNLDGIIIVLSNLAVLCEYTGEIDKAIDYNQRSLKLVEEAGDPSNQMATILGNIGGNYTYQGNYAKAIEYVTRSRKLHEKQGDKEGMMQALTESARLHMEIGDTALALMQFNESIGLCKALDNDVYKAKNYLLLAMLYNNRSDYNRALEYYRLSLELNKKLGFKSRIGDNHLYIGETYIKMGKLGFAREELNHAMNIFKESDEVAGVIVCLNQLGNILLEEGRLTEALQNGIQAMTIAQETKNVSAIQQAALLLYKTYKALGNDEAALRNHELHITIRDSLQSEENQHAVIRQEYLYAYEKQALSDSLEFAKKEAIKDIEIEKRGAILAKQRWALVATGAGIILLILLVTAIRKGKKRSDELLHNILPEEIAKELKEKGKADARNFDMVTILFTDFKGFTEASANMSAKDLVKEINSCFEAFDTIMGKYNIEKIKTIGDAYMAAGGLPVLANNSVKNTILAALEMQDFIVKRKEEQDKQGKISFEMRVGIHTGPVVAGIVGVKKFQYDIWGDTVNTASRMESSGEVGKVNISQATYDLLKDDTAFTFKSRGNMDVKGKGEMEMWFVNMETERDKKRHTIAKNNAG